MGFLGPRPPLAGWIAAALVFAGFTGLAARLPPFRENLVRPTFLKVLGLGVAITACFVEAAVFRKLLMDALRHGGHSVVLQMIPLGIGKRSLSHACHTGVSRATVSAALSPYR